MVTQHQPSKWILPVFLMFHCLFGENVDKTALRSKPIKSNGTIQKPTISDLQVLGERLKEVIGEPSQNQQLKKGTNSSLSQSLTRLKKNPINLTRQIKKAEFKSKFNVSWDKINDTPVFISGSELSEFSSQLIGAYSAQEIAKEFISVHKDVFRLEDSYSELETVKEFNDRYGKKHVKFQQVYQGIPVWGKTVVSHFEPEGDLYLINARFSPSPKELDLSQINYLKDQAIQIALDNIGPFSTVAEFNVEMRALLSYDSPVGKQYIWIEKDVRTPHLIWHVQVRPNAVDNWYYFIDAKTGEILEKYNNTQSDGPASGTATDLNGAQQTVHSYEISGWYYMIDSSRPIWQGGSLPGTPLGGLWTLRYQGESLYYAYSDNVNTWEADQVSAHSNTGYVFQYFYDTFGRLGIDSTGSTIISVVNVTSDGQPMDNAYWNGAYMAYGDGNTLFTPLAGALDVAAHEMTHGIVERTVSLEYKFQSGALNESFADVFGAMVDRDDWQIGEMIIANTDNYSSGALRDLSDPHQGGDNYYYAGWQPAHWDDFLDWDINYDNGGVHYNSGIPNKACYIMSDSLDIGREKTEQIYYRILEAEYLNSQATFIDMRLAAIQAAGELYGDDEVAAVTSAFDAVGIVGDEGSSAPEDQEIIEGQDWVTAINNNGNDHSLYLLDLEDGNQATQITETQVYTETANAVSSSANGSFIFFVNDMNDIVGYRSSDGLEINFTADLDINGIWHSIALSPNLSKFATTTIYIDSTIFVFDLAAGGPPNPIKLYSPTTDSTITSNVVLYADAMDWDPTSTYLIYDAFNSVPQNDGNDPPLEYWDVSLLYYEYELIFSIFSALPSGYSMANPSYASTNGNYFVFDYINNNDNQVWITAVDLYEGNMGYIEFIENNVGYPLYLPDDSKIVFQRLDNDGTPILRSTALSSKIEPANGYNSSTLYATDMIFSSHFTIDAALNVEDIIPIPYNFSLKQNYPNPFNPVTHVEFQIPYDVQVKISITDITGREIRNLEYSRFSAGAHRVIWDGRDRFGKNVSAGVYLCRVQAGDQLRTGKMLLLK